MDTTQALKLDAHSDALDTGFDLDASAVAQERARNIAETLHAYSANCPRGFINKVALFVDFPNDENPLADELRKALPRVDVCVFGQNEIPTVQLHHGDAVVVDTFVRGSRGLAALDADLHFYLGDAKYCVLFSELDQTQPQPVLGAMSAPLPENVRETEPLDEVVAEILDTLSRNDVKNVIIFDDGNELASRLNDALPGHKVLSMSVDEVTHLAASNTDAVIVATLIDDSLREVLRRDQKHSSVVLSVDLENFSVNEVEMPEIKAVRPIAVAAQAPLRSQPNGAGCEGCIVKCCKRNREKGEALRAAAARGEAVSPYVRPGDSPSMEDRLSVLTQRSAQARTQRSR